MLLLELSARLGCAVRGDGSVEVRRVAGIEDAEPGDLTFVASRRYAPHLATTRASLALYNLESDVDALVRGLARVREVLG